MVGKGNKNTQKRLSPDGKYKSSTWQRPGQRLSPVPARGGESGKSPWLVGQEAGGSAARREQRVKGEWAAKAGRRRKTIVFIGKGPMNGPQTSR